MKKAVATATAGLFVAFLAMFVASPAQAQDDTAREVACYDWSLRGASGQYPAITFGEPGVGSAVINAQKVKLVKPTEGTLPGTEFAAFKVDLTLAQPTDIKVDFTLSTEADFVNGAVRMFYYAAQDADTILATPSGVAIATENSGTLVIPDVTGTVGTIGLVYDGSNNAGGYVEFRDLRVGTIQVKFNKEHEKCVAPTTPPSPTPTGTSAPTTNPPATTGAPPVSGSGSLPVTGVKVAQLGIVGAVVVVIGAALVWLGRRRRTTTSD